MMSTTVEVFDMSDGQIVRGIHELGPRWASHLDAAFGDISTRMANLLSAIDRAGKASFGSRNHVEKVALIWMSLGELREEMYTLGEPFQTIPPELCANAELWREVDEQLAEFVIASVAGRRSQVGFFTDPRPERLALEMVYGTMCDLVDYLERTDGFLTPAVFRLNIPTDAAR